MEITGSGNLPKLSLMLSRQSLQGLPLRSGQTLNATVTSSDPSGKLTLEINGKLLQATTHLRLLAGMQLQLQVEKSATETVLRLTQSNQELLLRQHALRDVLPKQAPLKPLLEQLVRRQGASETAAKTMPSSAGGGPTAAARPAPTQLPQQPVSPPPVGTTQPAAPAQTDKTPARLEQSITRLIAALPTLSRLGTAEGLQQAITGSGLFMEKSLLQGSAPPRQGDVKTALLRLADAIRQNLEPGAAAGRPTGAAAGQPGESHSREALQALLRQVESGVARIQLQQLSNITQQSQGEERQQLSLELPLLHPQQQELETLRLTIRRDGTRRRSGAGNDWSISLHLEPVGFGAIHAVVSLASGKVSTTFWCERVETGELFRQSLATLQERFEQQGLQVGRCTALVGTPPPDLAVEDPVVSLQGLVDTQA